MYRALAVISASAWLALEPAAASATTDTSSHKPAHAKAAHGKTAHAATAHGKTAHAQAAHSQSAHGKSAHAEASSKKGKLRHAEADEAPAKGRKGHGKALASGKHRHEADEEAAAAETKPHAKGRHHGVEAVEAAAEEAHSTHRWHGEETEKATVIRADLKSTRACVAAHTRAHGRPKGSRARVALQRECAKEVEAARRKAEEEAAIRNWSAPHGPLIYPGAMPTTRAAMTEPVPETPANPAPPPSTPAADATAAGGAPGAATLTQNGQTVQGAAVVEQPAASQPASQGFLAGLFHARRGPQRAPGEPAPTLASLVGADETRLKTELGEPELMRAEGDGALWTYRLQGCALYVFLGRDASTSPWKVKGAQAGPLKRGGPTPEVDVCLKGPHS